jgi:hypothetical protein
MTTSITESRVDINALRAFTLHTILALAERHDMPIPLRVDGRDHSYGPCLWLHFDNDDAIRAWATVLGVTVHAIEDDDDDHRHLEASAVGREIWLGWSQVHLVAYVHDRAPVAEPIAAPVPVETKIWTCPHDCGYGIVDGPVADGEVPTFELIHEHLQEHEVIVQPEAASTLADPPLRAVEQAEAASPLDDRSPGGAA